MTGRPDRTPRGPGARLVPSALFAQWFGDRSPGERVARRRSMGGVLQVVGLVGPPQSLGGVAAVAETQVRALRAAGEVVRLAGAWLGPLPGNLPEGVIARRAHPVLKGQPLVLFFSVRLLVDIWFAARTCSVVHVHLARDLVTVPTVFLARLRGRPVVAQTHGMLSQADTRAKRLYDALLLKWALPHVDSWLTLGALDAERLSSLSVPSERLTPVVNAVSEPDRRWVDPERERAIFVARLHPRKQPGLFLEAAITLHASRPDAEFLIVGPDQGELASLEARIREAHASSYVRVLGAVPPAIVAELMAASTMLVLPSRDEPYPMTVLEGAALGMPMVVSAETGVSHILEREGGALVVEPDLDHVRSAMAELFSDPARRRELAESASRLYAATWRLQELSRMLRAVYASHDDAMPEQMGGPVAPSEGLHGA